MINLHYRLLVLIAFFPAYLQAQVDSINVRVHPIVELSLVIYHLSNNGQMLFQDEMNKPSTAIYIHDLMNNFKAYENHEAVRKADSLIVNGFWWLDGMLSFAVGFDSIPQLMESNYPNSTEKSKEKKEWQHLMYQFSIDTKFNDYFQMNSKLYSRIENEVRLAIPKENFISEMEAFYKKDNKSYNLIPSPLLFGGLGMGFGPKHDDNLFNIFSWFDKPSTDTLVQNDFPDYLGFGNSEQIRELSTHEFGHGFVNEIVYQNQELVNKYSGLLDTIYLEMKALGYADWSICLIEHIVRMGEIRVAERLGLYQQSKELYDEYVNDKHFIYLPVLLELVKQYENSQVNYKSFEDYFPQLLEDLGKQFNNTAVANILGIKAQLGHKKRQ